MKHILLSLALMLAMAMTSCGTSRHNTNDANQPAAPLADTQVWQLVSIRGREVKPQQGMATLVFHPRSGTFDGKASCNRFWGKYVVQQPATGQDGTTYECRFMQVETSQVVCPDAAMYAEQQLLLLLPKTTHIRLSAYSATLLQSGRELMKFELQ